MDLRGEGVKADLNSRIEHLVHLSFLFLSDFLPKINADHDLKLLRVKGKLGPPAGRPCGRPNAG